MNTQTYAQGEKMFAFDFEIRGVQARVEGWFSGNGPEDPVEFDIDAIWIGWSEANRGMPEDAGGPNPLDLSTLTDDEEEALTDAAFSAVAKRFNEPTDSLIPPLTASIALATERNALKVQRDALRDELDDLRSFFIAEAMEHLPQYRSLCAALKVSSP